MKVKGNNGVEFNLYYTSKIYYEKYFFFKKIFRSRGYKELCGFDQKKNTISALILYRLEAYWGKRDILQFSFLPSLNI